MLAKASINMKYENDALFLILKNRYEKQIGIWTDAIWENSHGD
jgi:hypothetical protein